MIIITGATSGIGHEIALKLASENKNLWLVGRNSQKMAILKAKINAINPCLQIKTSLVDLANEEQLNDFLKSIETSLDVLTGLINNAGLALDLTSIENSINYDIQTVINTNITALFLITKEVAIKMKRQNFGHIINIGSTAAILAYQNAAVYCASKAAVKTFTDGIRVDLMENQIKVTLIQPGIVETEFSLVRFKGDQVKANAVYQGIDALHAIDIANAVSYIMNTPKHVQIAELTIMATNQGNGFTIHRQK